MAESKWRAVEKQVKQKKKVLFSSSCAHTEKGRGPKRKGEPRSLERQWRISVQKPSGGVGEDTISRREKRDLFGLPWPFVLPARPAGSLYRSCLAPPALNWKPAAPRGRLERVDARSERERGGGRRGFIRNRKGRERLWEKGENLSLCGSGCSRPPSRGESGDLHFGKAEESSSS